jgi:predicted ATP-dependent endonuclease of OLD family
MQLKTIILRNFRSYKEEIRISINNLTAFIGMNDIGKSTILEALEIFFNNQLVKIEKEDVSVGSEDQTIHIGCEFIDFPQTLILDESASTNLKDEYLLNESGNLEIHKVFDCSKSKISETVFAYAQHPTAAHVNDLLSLKNAQLKKRISDLGISTNDVKLNSNPTIRKAIWSSVSDLMLLPTLIPLNEEDTKKIWLKLEENMPIYALFQADRPSRDDDSEIQDPMKIAIAEAVKSVEGELQNIRKVVEEKAVEVAERTLEKLKEIDPTLASQLKPNFKSEPKWDGFKLSLTGDDDIPINKRGSGVRRLILLSFFRAEAEKRRNEKNSPSIIYAVEEPEASQHPNNQKLIADALLRLAEEENRQVLVTTHVPGFANLISVEFLRYVHRDNSGNNQIDSGEDKEVAERIATALGSYADSRVKVMVYVEGPTDVRFLRKASSLHSAINPSIIDLENDPRVAIIPAGGSNLGEWVYENYLEKSKCAQVHIYDRGCDEPPRYQTLHDEINRRKNDVCFLTQKREIENYVHFDLIRSVFDVEIDNLEDNDDVPLLLAKALHYKDNSPGKRPWEDLMSDVNGQKRINDKMKNVKKRIHNEVVPLMTCEQLIEVDSEQEIIKWLEQITKRVNK